MSNHSIETLQKFLDHITEQNVRTEGLCAQHPEMAAVRDLLLATEKDVHVGEGWDSRPRLFLLRRHDHSGRLSTMPLPALNKLMREHDGRPPEALEYFARMFESVRSVVDGDSPNALVGGIRGGDGQDFFQLFRMVRGRRGEDLLSCGSGQTFLGVGFLMEGWMASPAPGEDPAFLRKAAAQHQIHARADRMEMRQIHYSGRDGVTWDVMRVRAVDGFTFPRMVIAHTEDDRWATGGVPESVSRMCNAIASNPVPIIIDRD